MKLNKFGLAVIAVLLLGVVAFSYAQANQITNVVILTPSPSPQPSSTPEILEIDTRRADDLKKLESFMEDYCKRNSCASPSPKPKQKVDAGYCFVEKNGSFWMTGKECQELHDADPHKFVMDAFENCLQGKNKTIGTGTREELEKPCMELLALKKNEN